MDEYNAIFQAEADKFYDGRYIVNARTINKVDSLLFDTKCEYWLGNVNEESLMTNKTGDQDTGIIVTNNFVNKFYIVPRLSYVVSSDNLPANGSEITINSKKFIYNGNNGYVYYNNNYIDWSKRRVYYDAEEPILLQADGIQNIGSVVSEYLSNFDDSGIYSYDLTYNSNAIFSHPEIFDGEDFIYFFSGGDFIEKKYYFENHNSNLTKLYADGTNSSSYGLRFPKTLTFGYRPVLTIKISDDIFGKDINSSLRIGDNVKYEANGYKNWKVLSIDKESNTVDVISGGVVKNLSLYGKDDYDNYEDILQKEVDAYISGDNAISARAVKVTDIDSLNIMNDKVAAMYWYDSKKNYQTNLSRNNLQTSSIKNDGNNVYGVGVLWVNTGDYYVNDIVSSSPSSNIRRYWVQLFSENWLTQYYLGSGNLNYIAGLRPVITLKYDSVEVLSEKQAQKLDKSSQDYDKYYITEQGANNFTKDASILLSVYNGEDENDNSNDDDYFDSDIVINSSKSIVENRSVNVELDGVDGVISFATILLIIYELLSVFLIGYFGWINFIKKN